jgi:ribonucleoside-diphosphate reductase alpha chain
MLTQEQANISIDLSLDSLFDSFGLKTLKERYFVDGETSPQHAFARVCAAYADDPAHAQRLYDYVANQWFMFASPVLANGGTTRGLPISCFLMFVDNDRASIGRHYMENLFLATEGGGVSGAWSAVQSKGTKTRGGTVVGGLIPHLKTIDSAVLEWKQGDLRAASYAAYLDLDHPEIEEFLTLRKAANTSDINRKALNLHHGVNIPDRFMEIIERCMLDPDADDSWPLVDPATKAVTKVLSAKKLWQDLLTLRGELNEPYFHFIDRSNEQLPVWLKEKGLRVNSSNLCAEITLPTSPDRTAVCCLSSVNAAKWDDWKDHPTFIEDLFRMLDNVIDDFCARAPAELEKAVRSAQNERSIGLGCFGFHTYLQRNMIPFEGMYASSFNYRLFKGMHDKGTAANRKLALEKGEAPDARGYGVRFSHMFAIAPNATSSIICGNVSPSIEPIAGNAYGQKTLSGWNIKKNADLIPVLQKYGMDTMDTWISIATREGSVQHLTFLSDLEREVFKTFAEIDQNWVVEHAFQRAPHICQSQSLNLAFAPSTPTKYLHDVHFKAWKMRHPDGKGLKSLYYVRSDTVLKPQLKYDLKKVNVAAPNSEECLSCAG